MKRTTERIALLSKLADMMAWKFWSKRQWLDRQELLQDAWLILLETELEFDERCGVPAGAFLWNYGVRKMHRMQVFKGAPVTGGRDALKDLMDIRSRPVGSDRSTGEVELKAATSDADMVVHMQRRRRAVRAAVECVQDGALAMRALLNEETPAEIAADLGVDVWRVYRANCWAKQAVKVKVGKVLGGDHWDS